MRVEPQQQAFADVKEALTTSPVISLFDQKRDNLVCADASACGLGTVLLQKQLKPISYKSRSLTPTEERCTQMEKEALASPWASVF